VPTGVVTVTVDVKVKVAEGLEKVVVNVPVDSDNDPLGMDELELFAPVKVPVDVPGVPDVGSISVEELDAATVLESLLLLESLDVVEDDWAMTETCDPVHPKHNAIARSVK